MDSLTFLRRILPASGHYIAARQIGKGFKHQVCDTLEELAHYIAEFDNSGVPTYHACSAFRERDVVITKVENGEEVVKHRVRIQKNVRMVRSFWMDLDVKPPGTPNSFESQEAAAAALYTFCEETGLPMPLVVSSGFGIHIYWVLAQEIMPESWRETAEGLKRLAAHYKFYADPMRTADSASVLRTPGTWNRKQAQNPRPVEVICDQEGELQPGVFAAQVRAALTKAKVELPREAVRTPAATQVEKLNAEFAVQHDFAPISAYKLAEKCQQIRVVRDSRGVVPEPHWYAAIQVLAHAIEGDEIVHEWSKGDPRYSREETDRKIIQIRSQGMGPTLCSTFESRVPGGCNGCQFKGKIASPATVGAHIVQAPAPVITKVDEVTGQTVSVSLPSPPAPFKRGQNGGIYVDIDGIEHKIYEHDMFPVEIAYDETLGYETVRMRHHTPMDGWREFTFQSSLLARPVDFEMVLRDNHIQPLNRNQVTAYTDSYLRKIRSEKHLRRLFKGQGWKGDALDEFVLGDKLYKKNEIVHAGFSQGAFKHVKHVRPHGEFQPWFEITRTFDTPGLEPHLFMFLLGFAAPLLRLDNRDGFTVAALGNTNGGKSSTARFMSSIYGHPTEMWMKGKSSENAIASVLGAFSSLPVYHDEISTIKPPELRDLVYMVTTGKHRDTLTRNREHREGPEWSTILLTSSNRSLYEKLTADVDDATAESMRVFEFWVPTVDALIPTLRSWYPVINEHYGHAGPRYIQKLVQNRADVLASITPYVDWVRDAFKMEERERFWTQAIALSLLGGHLAQQWGIIACDPLRCKDWLYAETRKMRATIKDATTGAISMLSNYFAEHIGECLVVAKNPNAGFDVPLFKPLHKISSRYDKETGLKLTARNHIKPWIEKHHGNWNQLKTEWAEAGVLLGISKEVLGKGTDIKTGQTECLKFNMKHPLLGHLEETT